MGLRFRKSKKIGPFRITFSKSGISASVGIKGLRITKTASGRIRTTASIPGTGISYVKESGKRDSSATKKTSPATHRKEEKPGSPPCVDNRYYGDLPLFHHLKVEDYDEALEDCARFVIATRKATIKDLQLEFRFGYTRCARIMDQLEEIGVIGPYHGSEARQILFVPIQQNE